MSFTYKYPHPAVTTDCVILTFHEDKLKILLIKRGIEPFKGMWALPGGFMKIDESAEECAIRELTEETGVRPEAIKQFHTFTAPGRDPRERVITIAFYALTKWQNAVGADDAMFADWIPVNSLPPLAFDHKTIIDLALQAIRKDIFFEPVGFNLIGEVFSMSELQKVYEAILGKEFDRRNFAKKMKHIDILDEINLIDHDDCSVATVADDKILPLPFLNKDNPESLIDIDDCSAPTSMDCCPPHESLFCCNDVSLMEESAETPKKRRRKGNFFRFNKKKYDRLKDEDSFEF